MTEEIKIEATEELHAVALEPKDEQVLAIEDLKDIVDKISNMHPSNFDLCEDAGALLLEVVDMLVAKDAEEFEKEKLEVIKTLHEIENNVYSTRYTDINK